MRRILALLLMLFSLAAHAEEASPTEALDAYTVARFQARDVVGGAVIIARDGEILYGYDFGYKNASRTWPVSLDTCFHAASVTKMVSAIGLMQLLEEKNIPLDTPLKDVVGFQVVNPAFPEADITIARCSAILPPSRRPSTSSPTGRRFERRTTTSPCGRLPARPMSIPTSTGDSSAR